MKCMSTLSERENTVPQRAFELNSGLFKAEIWCLKAIHQRLNLD
jgi:hypothetical protein